MSAPTMRFYYQSAHARGKCTKILGSAHAGSECALSEKYKFLYIHVLKSAGMSVKTFLKNALCGTTAIPCPRGDDVLEIVDCSWAVMMHSSSDNYFI